MRVFNEDKTQELYYYDAEGGRLLPDKLLVAHHPKVQGAPEIGHYVTTATYPNGGKDIKWVVDIPEVEAKEAWDEYEDIQVYIPYTAEEKAKQNRLKYESRVEQLIREKYSLNAELAILRQRDKKPQEFADYDYYAENCKSQAKFELGMF